MPHGVEGEEVVLADAVRVAEELEAGLEDARLGVLQEEPGVSSRTSSEFCAVPPRARDAQDLEKGDVKRTW